MTLFERVKELTGKRGMSISEVERKAGLGENYIYTLKKSENPRRKSIEAIAKVLGVTPDYLFGRNDTPEWANEKDTKDLETFLERNLEGGMTYGGEDLTEEEKQQVRVAMTTIFWKRHKHD